MQMQEPYRSQMRETEDLIHFHKREIEKLHQQIEDISYNNAIHGSANIEPRPTPFNTPDTRIEAGVFEADKISFKNLNISTEIKLDGVILKSFVITLDGTTTLKEEK